MKATFCGLFVVLAVFFSQKAHAADQTFYYTGADQTFTVPAGANSITVKMWGGGGGSSYHHDDISGVRSNVGGGAGFASSSIAVTPGETLTIKVGSGGSKFGSNTPAFPNGGSGSSYSDCDDEACWDGNTGSGGGSSCVARGTNVLIEAGGGSGATANQVGTAGGGDRLCSPHGSQPGANANGTLWESGAGGGYCGGASLQGGSSFAPVGGTQIAGTGVNPGNASDADRGGAGQGAATYSFGSNGIVKVTYEADVTPVPTATSTPAPTNTPAATPTPAPVSDGPGTFAYIGADQNFVVPDNVSSITVKMWGAGGEWGTQDLGNNPGENQPGGGAGFAMAMFDVVAGQNLTVRVGGKPLDGLTNAGWPNGGHGSTDPLGFGFNGGAGGSSSLLLNGQIIIEAAGGNGGAGGYDPVAGGGIRLCVNPGNQQGVSYNVTFGSGGGGYCGGSAGVGASSFVPSGGTEEAGSENLPGHLSDPDRSGAGLGGLPGYIPASHGLVRIGYISLAQPFAGVDIHTQTITVSGQSNRALVSVVANGVSVALSQDGKTFSGSIAVVSTTCGWNRRKWY